MTQDQDVYHKVGRGGAGNYYTTKPTDNATKNQEAQAVFNTSVAAPPPSTLTRGGRGGAGNLIDNTHKQENQIADEATAAAINAGLKQQTWGILSGRGGAGNYRATSGESEDKAVVDKELERKVREVVDKGLKMPDKVHQAPEKVQKDDPGA